MIIIYEKILLGLDSSDDAKRAAEKVAEIHNKLGSEVIVFHSIEHHMLPKVVPLSVPFLNQPYYPIPSVDRRKIREEYAKLGQKLLDQAEKMFTMNEVHIERRLIQDESPADYILRIVDEEHFDLVVLGCKGQHSKLKRIFMGTVATKVLNEANCDVLIVR